MVLSFAATMNPLKLTPLGQFIQYLCFPTCAVLICSFFLAVEGAPDSAEPTCSAGEHCDGKHASPYYWPHAHGHPDYYGNAPWPGPTDLQSSFRWRWNGPTGVLYSESFVGTVIDDKKNIYVNGDRTVYKLSPDGQLMWSYATPSQAAADGCAIMDGVLFGDGADGFIFAVDMESGRQKWVTKASTWTSSHYGHISAHNGVVVTQGDTKAVTVPAPAMGCGTIRGLNATDGNALWAFEPDNALWDWFPTFPDDNSVISMDVTGKLYRLWLRDGALVWKAGGMPNTWTDGASFVATQGLAYAVSVDQNSPCLPRSPGEIPQCGGIVAAYKVSDGSQVWKQHVPKPPNTSPVAGRVGKDSHLSLVMPIGQQTGHCELEPMQIIAWFSMFPQFFQNYLILFLHNLSIWLGDYSWILWGKALVTHDVAVFDAETGSHLWTWQGPTMHFKLAPGDKEGFMPRYLANPMIRPVACPTPWNAPRIGHDGTIFVGNQNGNLYAIRDMNGDNRIDENEVSVYETKGVFTHQGTSHAPGMLVAINFDSVFVFKS